MKQVMKRLASLALVLTVTLGLVGAGAVDTFAASGWQFEFGDTLHVGEIVTAEVENRSTEAVASIKSLKSNNKKVASVKKDESGYTITPKREGKVTFTVKIKTPAGKVKTLKRKLTIKPYPNPMKSLKIAGKNVRLSERRIYEWNEEKFKKTKVKIDLKLAKGWKITYVEGGYGEGGSLSEIIKPATIKKALKNGTAIKFPKKYDELNIYFIMRKGDERIKYKIDLMRW